MSAESEFHAAMLAALRSAAQFGGALNGMFEGPAVKATTPYAEIGELIANDWGTKDIAGRELRSLILVRDRGEGPARIQSLAAAAEAAMAGIPRDLPGWRIASQVAIRTRIVRDGPGGWSAVIEHRVRMLAA